MVILSLLRESAIWKLLNYRPSRDDILFSTSPALGKRPSLCLEKISWSFNTTSNTPPLEGAIEISSMPNSLLTISARPAALAL